MTTVASRRLDQALKHWEWTHLELESIMYHFVNRDKPNNPYGAIPPEFTEWRKFRQQLLNNDVLDFDFNSFWYIEEQLRKFIQDSELATRVPAFARYHDVLGRFGTFPLELFAWTRQSRRVFQLNQELQHTLTSACYSKIPWREVMWPFDSFMIELAEPMKVFSKKLEQDIYFDSLLIAKIMVDGTELFGFRMFVAIPDQTKYDFNGFSLEERQEVRRIIDGRQPWKKYVRITERGLRRVQHPEKYKHELSPLMQGQAIYPFSVGEKEGREAVAIEPTDILQKIREAETRRGIARDNKPDQHEIISASLKVAVGLSLYLESISASAGAPRNIWTQRRAPNSTPIKGGGRGIIIDEALVCEVVYHSTIDPTKYYRHNSDGEQTGFKRPHWRRRYRRRPRGTPPGTPRTIKVGPKLINPHLIPKYGIIGGTATKIEPEYQEWE